jgi:septal ring factor EnvC (AmiA/AmiB activator)
MIRTPPRPLPRLHIDEVTETPAPARARVNNLQNQVSELVRKEHAATVSRQRILSILVLPKNEDWTSRRRNITRHDGVDKADRSQRRHRSEVAGLENKIAAQQTQLESSEAMLKGVQGTLAATQKELARCTAEGEGMRDEVGGINASHRQLFRIRVAPLLR